MAAAKVGSLTQDIAAIQELRELSHEYFHNHGFDDYELSTVFHQWMGGFPEDEAKAFSVIARGAAVAGMSGATKVITKSPHEAFGIPTAAANAQWSESFTPDAQHGQRPEIPAVRCRGAGS